MAEDDDKTPKPNALTPLTSANPGRPRKEYSVADKYTALAALDINGGNVYRTAIAFGLPESTLRTWRDERTARGEGPSKLERERRGNLASKLESVVHSVVESITPETIQKATLSQRGVFIGIAIDKLRLLLGQGIEPDPAAELCRLLNINRAQLPSTLQLDPGEPIPEGFGPVIETSPDPSNPNSFEPEDSDQSANTQALIDIDDDEPAN